MGSINDMPSYQQYFGTSTTGTETGIVFSIYQAGGIAGSLVRYGPLE